MSIWDGLRDSFASEAAEKASEAVEKASEATNRASEAAEKATETAERGRRREKPKWRISDGSIGNHPLWGRCLNGIISGKIK